MTSSLLSLEEGNIPLLVSIPHLGTQLPAELLESYSSEAKIVSDTDWHLDTLYGFARAMGASVLRPSISRYVIDLNRPPTGESLYPGQTTTGLCPTETFEGVALYRDGHEPDGVEIERRLRSYWQPYHQALKLELERLNRIHGKVLLWEAHSIRSVLPRLFNGKLPDLNFGTNSGAACNPAIFDAALLPLLQQPVGVRPTHAVNGRFKGGYITRHYSQPAAGIHVIQLEICQSLYMNEVAPFAYRADLAAKIQPLLRQMMESALGALDDFPG